MVLKERSLSEIKKNKNKINIFCIEYIMSPINILKALILFSFLVFTLGCASLQQKNNVLAFIDGEPIVKDDLLYALETSHRTQAPSTATSFNISRYLEKLIDDMLVIQEARRMQLESSTEVQEAVNRYILSMSSQKLYQEEVAQKVTVTKKDIVKYYKKNYEQFLLNIIRTDSNETASDILNDLKAGADFNELAIRNSSDPSMDIGDAVLVTRNSLSPFMEKTVTELKPGEISDVLRYKDKYYIIKLSDRREAPDNKLDKFREKAYNILKKQKENKLSADFLEKLLKESNPHIEKELLASVTSVTGKEETENLANDKRTLAEINGSVFTIKDYIASAADTETRKLALNNWIYQKLIDKEALRRQYDAEPDFIKKLYRYKNKLLNDAFINKAVLPEIIITDSILEDFYVKNRNNYLNPSHFRIQQISVTDRDEAYQILESLQKGTNFSWMAKNRSKDTYAHNGGAVGWFSKDKLPEPVQEFIDNLGPGDISPVFKVDSFYRIIRLQDITGGKAEEFSKVKNLVYRDYIDNQRKTIYNNYLKTLREEAQINIREDAVRSLEKEIIK